MMMSTHYFRQQLGLTQQDFADMFELSLATVKNWDSRKNMPLYIKKMLDYILDLEKRKFELACENIALRKDVSNLICNREKEKVDLLLMEV